MLRSVRPSVRLSVCPMLLRRIRYALGTWLLQSKITNRKPDAGIRVHQKAWPVVGLQPRGPGPCPQSSIEWIFKEKNWLCWDFSSFRPICLRLTAIGCGGIAPRKSQRPGSLLTFWRFTNRIIIIIIIISCCRWAMHFYFLCFQQREKERTLFSHATKHMIHDVRCDVP